MSASSTAIPTWLFSVGFSSFSSSNLTMKKTKASASYLTHQRGTFTITPSSTLLHRGAMDRTLAATSQLLMSGRHCSYIQLRTPDMIEAPSKVKCPPIPHPHSISLSIHLCCFFSSPSIPLSFYSWQCIALNSIRLAPIYMQMTLLTLNR